MLNYQFFGTAGIFSGILILIALIFLILFGIAYDGYWYYVVQEVFLAIAIICFGLVILFWVVMGVIAGLDSLWNWNIIAH